MCIRDRATGLETRTVRVGSGVNEFRFPAPLGWVREEPSSNEVVYRRPGGREAPYSLRVEQVVSQDETIPDILQRRIEELERDEDDVNYQQTFDTLTYDYVDDEGFRRFGITTWLSLSRSPEAEAEIALVGREVDAPGMRELITLVIRGMREG